MTPKLRWRTFFEGGKPDRVPCDYWGTAEVTRRLCADLGCKSERELWCALGVDKAIFLAPRNANAKEDTWHIPSLFSVWNIRSELIPYLDGSGFYEEAIDPPLAQARTARDLDAFPWPRPEDWDVTSFRRECLEWSDYPIVTAAYEPFYLYCRLRGMEQALEDLVVNPEFAGAVMERIYDIHAGIVRGVMHTAGDLVDFIYVAEDLGTQESLLMSPSAFRRSIKPWLAKMIALAHSFGAKVFHHDDGAIRKLIPDLIEIGIDVLNPIQWRCRGMDREALAADFGRDLVFHGGIDNQFTLPFGSPEDVRRQVAENIALFRDCRGYVVGPCHNVQVNTPTANVVAMYDAVREYGDYCRKS